MPKVRVVEVEKVEKRGRAQTALVVALAPIVDRYGRKLVGELLREIARTLQGEDA